MTADVVVIGAGMAGLACARQLAAAGRAPLVLDKGRAPGGRMATRRADCAAGPLRFDHGAQYLTARDPGFAQLIEGLAGRAVARWPDGSGRARWVGLPGMSGLPRALAEGLELRQGTEVTGLHPDGAGWQVETTRDTIAARAVVLTVPAPQAAALIGADHPLAAALGAVRLEPCLTLMAAFPAAAPRPFTDQVSETHPLAWIAQDSTKPGRPDTATSWVAQAAPGWSAAHLETDSDALAERMLPLLAERLGVAAQDALHAAAHRWRYARVTAPLGRPFLHHGRLWLGGDWCLGARVEAAWTSGTAIATELLDHPHGR